MNSANSDSKNNSNPNVSTNNNNQSQIVQTTTTTSTTADQLIGQSTINSGSSDNSNIKKQRNSLQQLPKQQIDELQKSLQNPKPITNVSLASNQLINITTSSNTNVSNVEPVASTSKVNIVTPQNQNKNPNNQQDSIKRRTSDIKQLKQFSDLSLNNQNIDETPQPSSSTGDEQTIKSKDQSKESKINSSSTNKDNLIRDKSPIPQIKPISTLVTTSSNVTTHSTTNEPQLTTINKSNSQSNQTKSAANNSNNTVKTTTTMPVLSADYYLNYQKEIERLKSRLEEERKKLNDVPFNSVAAKLEPLTGLSIKQRRILKGHQGNF